MSDVSLVSDVSDVSFVSDVAQVRSGGSKFELVWLTVDDVDPVHLLQNPFGIYNICASFESGGIFLCRVI